MDFDELKEELRQAYRDGDLTVQEYLAELKALREDSTAFIPKIMEQEMDRLKGEACCWRQCGTVSGWNGATKGKFWNFPRALRGNGKFQEFPLEI